MRAVLLLALSGCSMFATEGPRPPPGPTACNRSDQPVVADIILGLSAVLATTVASLEHGGTANTVTPLALAGVFGASAGYGAIQVHRCRAAHLERPAWSLEEMPAVM